MCVRPHAHVPCLCRCSCRCLGCLDQPPPQGTHNGLVAVVHGCGSVPLAVHHAADELHDLLRLLQELCRLILVAGLLKRVHIVCPELPTLRPHTVLWRCAAPRSPNHDDA